MTSPVPPSSTGSASRVQSTIKCHPLGFRERKKPVLNDKKNSAPQNKSLLCNIVYYFCSMDLEDFWWISHLQFWIYSIRALINEGKWNKLQYNITYFGLKTFLNMIQLKNLTPKTHKLRHDCFFDKTSKLNYWVFVKNTTIIFIKENNNFL